MTHRWMHSDERMSLGEGPLWHPSQQQLYVTDLILGIIRVFDEGLGLLRRIEMRRPTTAMTWQADGSLLGFHDRGEVTRLSDSGIDVILQLPDESLGLFNDVLADPVGRILCGVQPVNQRRGRLYCIEPDGAYRVLLDDILEPNGLGLSPDGSTLYFADSEAGVVWRMGYDLRTGTVGQRSRFFVPEPPAIPDGLTVDAAGSIWIALWNGASVVQLSPAGAVLARFGLPVPRVTSLTFGGDRFTRLFVTSAAVDTAHPVQPARTLEGAVFSLRQTHPGRPEYPSDLRL